MELSKFNGSIARHRIYTFGLGLGFFILLSFIGGSVTAQSVDSWSEPVNLSQSGSASDPSMVVDLEGNFHVLWIDEFAGPVYVTGKGVEWSQPLPVNLPFGDSIPVLVADDNGYIHAFWRDNEGSLLYGRARANAFHSSSAWGLRAQLAESALDMDIVKDELGNLHLSYVRPIESGEFPAGVYYRQMRNATSTWSAPILLYESPYFRALNLDESNIDVSASLVDDSIRVFVAWDNLPRERVYFAKSDDGGRTWDTPLEIDKPDTGIGTTSSSNILVEANGSQVLLIWQANHNETTCDQFYQFSSDAGITWSSRQRVQAGFLICPDENQVLSIEDGSLLIMNGIESYIQAWDGGMWSEPQFQQSLSAFIDPETERIVEFDCRQSTVLEGTALYVIGCDDDVGKDIWLLNRQLLDVPIWYPEEVVWSSELSVSKGEQRISMPVLVSDSQERMHAIWSQADSAGLDELGKAIFYSRWEEGQWSSPEEVIDPAEGKAEQPAGVIGDQDQLYVAWSGGQEGQIYFSSADAGQAIVPTSWREPVQLPSPSAVGSAPSVVVDQQGVIYVSYAIPLNEARGIYLVNSTDEGQTWSEPIQVFDAEAAGWSMVDNPRLAITDQEHLHILWTQFTLPSGQGPVSLLYSLSEDGGKTWSLPQVVVENPIVWSHIVGIGNQTVQRIWQETGSSGTTMWHEESLDNGESWYRTVPVSVFGETDGYPSLTTDRAGRLHLFLPVRNDPGNFVVQHWLYDQGRWSAERNLELIFPTNTELKSVVGRISDQGNLGVLIADLLQNVEASSHQFQLIFFNRPLEIPAALNTSVLPAATEVQAISTPAADKTQAQPTSTQMPAGKTETPANILVGPDTPNSSTWITIGGPLLIAFVVLVAAYIIFRGIRTWR
jgi:hypothetical protein